MFRNAAKTMVNCHLLLWIVAIGLSAAAQTDGNVTTGAGCPPGSETKTRLFTAGIKDDFRLPLEATSKSEKLSAIRPRWNSFDEGKVPLPLGHTFKELPCYVVAATLTATISPIGKSRGDEIVGLELNGNRFKWSVPLQAIARKWPSKVDIQLNLGQLPRQDGGPLNFLDQLSDGMLDVFFGESVAVDYLALEITYCEFLDCNNNCVPDKQDISNGTSQDKNRNGIPDECEPGNTDPPSIQVICDPYISIGLGSDCCAWQLLSPDVITTGNVGTVTITNDFDNSQSDILAACFPPGITQVTFIAITDSGLTAQCTTTIHVYDQAPPTIMPR